MQKIKILSIIIIFILLSCGPTAKFLSPKFEKPSLIAILPTINKTADVNGGIVFRNLLYKTLEEKKYTKLLINNVVDSLLNLEGITDGGQLSTIEDEELFRNLRVDGLIYIELLECTYQSLGIKETRHVLTSLKLKLYPGIIIWEDDREVKEGKSIFQTALNAIVDPVGTLKESAKDLGVQYLIKFGKMALLSHELRPEMQTIINTSCNTLPKSNQVHKPINFARFNSEREKVKRKANNNNIDDILAGTNTSNTNTVLPDIELELPNSSISIHEDNLIKIERCFKNKFVVKKVRYSPLQLGCKYKVLRKDYDLEEYSEIGIAEVFDIKKKYVGLTVNLFNLKDTLSLYDLLDPKTISNNDASSFQIEFLLQSDSLKYDQKLNDFDDSMQSNEILLDIQMIHNNFFLINQNSTLKMKIGDIFNIVRIENGNKLFLGNATVTKFGHNSVILRSQIINPYILTEKDKLIYE